MCMLCARAGQTTARESNLSGPFLQALAECVDYVALYHRVLNNFFTAISMTHALAPTSTRS